MKLFGFALLTALTVQLFPPIASAAPVVLGLTNKHPLTEPQVGQLLIGELQCLACHSRKDAPQSLERSAPDLAAVGSRVAPTFLRRFIASPSAAHSGSMMPDLLAGEPTDQRDKIAEALTHFLVAQSPRKFERQSISAPVATTGKALFHSIGCVVCHSPRDVGGKEITRDGVVELSHVPAKYSLTSLSDFLLQPTRVRPSGRMPDMKLTPVEARAIASYLLGKADTKAAALEPQEKLVALGKEHFQRLNCAACHKLSDVPAAKSFRALEGAVVSRGCLSAAKGKAPWFNLSVAKRRRYEQPLRRRPTRSLTSSGWPPP